MKLFLILVLSTCALAYNVQRNRIVGGSYASEAQFPYQISQRVYRQHSCGGSIINENTILTASHCVDGKRASWLDIVVGSVTLDDGVWHSVSHYVMHEDYNSATLVNDIAVIKVTDNIQFWWKVQPIYIETSHVNAGADSVIAGWGLTAWPSEEVSNDLFYINGTIYDTEKCRKHFQGNQFPVLDSNICNFAQYGQGVCRADSGGGLVVNGRHVGISSWVRLCAVGSPDVFTKTSSYADWIYRQ